MKKLLLFVCAVITAISADAQYYLTPTSSLDKNIVTAKRFSKSSNINSSIEADNLSNIKNMDEVISSLSKAPAQSDLYGNYIEDHMGDFHECYNAELKAYESTEEGVTTTYVQFDIFNGYASVLGIYDANTGKITIPLQYCYNHETYGQFALYAIVEEEGALYYSTDPITFTVEEDGSLTLDQAGLSVRMLEGDYQGSSWDVFIGGYSLYPTNAVYSGTRNGRITNNEWVDFTVPVYVEDYEFSVNVYGFAENGCATIDINDDGTVSVATGQPLASLYLQDENEYATYGETLNLVAVEQYTDPATGKGMIRRNYNQETISGTISGNTITLNEYFAIASKPDADGLAYHNTWHSDGTTITLDEGNYIASGIEEVTMTREEKIKNTKTYNIMGQQVDRAKAKGLLIRDGKKYIKK